MPEHEPPAPLAGDAESNDDSTDAPAQDIEPGRVPPLESETVLVPRRPKTTTQVSFKGPLPLPQLLQGYDNVVPGAAERIIAMAEREQEHRHDMMRRDMGLDERVVTSVIRYDLAGLICAVVIVVFTLGLGSTLIFAGKEVAGFTSMLTGVAIIAGLFIHARRREQAKQEHKEEADTDDATDE